MSTMNQPEVMVTITPVATAEVKKFMQAENVDPAKGGIYTHRWFVVRTANVDHLTQSSVDAWTYSEADTEMRIAGFWRSREPSQDDTATILMIVYYPDLTAWEASRFWKPKPAGASQPNREVWGDMFRKRRDITLQFLIEAIVQTTLGGLVGLSAGLLAIYMIPPVTRWLSQWFENAYTPTKLHVPAIFLSLFVSISVRL